MNVSHALVDQYRQHQLERFAADYPDWTVYTTAGAREHRIWVAVPVPAGSTPLAAAQRIRSGRIVAETPTALRAALAREAQP